MKILRMIILSLMMIGLVAANAHAARVSGDAGSSSGMYTVHTTGPNISETAGGHEAEGEYSARRGSFVTGSAFSLGGQKHFNTTTRNSATAFGMVGSITTARALSLGCRRPRAFAKIEGAGEIAHYTGITTRDGSGQTGGVATYTYKASDRDSGRFFAGAGAIGYGYAVTGGHVSITRTAQGTYGHAISMSYSTSTAIGGSGPE